VKRGISAIVLSALATVLVSNWFRVSANEAAVSVPFKSIPTFSTENIGRQGHFYVGGKWIGPPGKETMDGAMYVEVWVPKKIRHPYPVLFVVGGGGQSNISLLQTPDGRPGWAYDFVNKGYTVYMIDPPGFGRSAHIPTVDEDLIPPRSGPLMEEVWSGGRPPATPRTSWPQYKKHTQWPSDAPNKGKMGDPVFDYYAKTELEYVPGYQERLTSDAYVQLLGLIGKPIIMVVNSGFAPAGWVAADARPKLVKAIVAAEPWAPPIQNAERGATGPGRLWGVTNLPVHYDPPVKDASELQPVRQDKADAPDLIPCWVQQEPAHKLINLESIPVLQVSGEASYHRPYSHCVAKWLNQAGVKTTFVRLEDVGLPGNGHQMMSDKNSADIAKFFMSWLDKNVH
jgi:pimeloyl-ACP methyl ester carboxylesterase